MSDEVSLELGDMSREEAAVGTMGADIENNTATNVPRMPNSSQSEAVYSDASGALFSIYLQTADEEDTKMTESWKGDADGILVFTGLFSATVAGFLGLSYQNLRQNSQDTSAFYLAYIYQVTAASNSTNPVLPIPSNLSNPSTFSPSSSAIWVNILWFMGLIISLTCALLATLLQQWARRYLRVTRTRYSLLKRARVRAFFAEGLERRYFPLVVETLPGLLHASVFLFFAGLPIFVFGSNQTVFAAVLSCVGLSGLSYLLLTFMPLVFHDSPYHTPLSTLFWLLLVGVRCLFLELFKLTISFAVKFRIKLPAGHPWPTKNTVHNLTALAGTQLKWLKGGMIKEMESHAYESSWQIDARALLWAFDFADEEAELEQIIASIPGFYKSSLVKDPQKILSEASEKISSAILQLMGRSLSSDLVDEMQRKQRSKMCLKVLEVLPDLQRATIRQSLRLVGTDVFKWIELGLLADRHDNFEAKTFTALVTAHTRGYDERWLPAMTRQLGLSEPIPPQGHFAQVDDLLFSNLLDFVLWMLFHHDSVDYEVVENVLTALQKFDHDVTGTSPELQHQFCSMWNNILEFQGHFGPTTNFMHYATGFDNWQRARANAQNLVRNLARNMGRTLGTNFEGEFSRRVARNPTSLVSFIRFLVKRFATLYNVLHASDSVAASRAPVSTDSWDEDGPVVPIYRCDDPSHRHTDIQDLHAGHPIQ